MIEDYTYLWHDVRPHPQLRHGRGPGDGLPDAGRAHARPGRAGAGPGARAGRALRRRQAAVALPVRDARREQVARRRATASTASSSTCPTPTVSDPRACPSPDRPDARARRGPGFAGRARGVEDLLERGNGAARQIVVYEANHDLARSWPRSSRPPPFKRGRGVCAAPQSSVVSTGGPELFVICKNCGSEVSPYITECPYCGNRLRKRAPKLDREAACRETPQAAPADAVASAPAPRRDPGDPRRCPAPTQRSPS